MKKVKYITDGAMVSAVLIVFLLLSRFTGGFLEETFLFVIPIPIAIYTIKYGFKYGLIPTFASSLLAFLILNPIRAACFIVPSNIVGLIYGEVARRSKNLYFKVLVAVIGALIINILTTVIFSEVLFGYTIVEDTKTLIKELLSLFSFLNLSQNFANIFEALMIGLIPSIILATSLLEGVLTHAITAELSKRILKVKTQNILQGFKFAVPRILTYFVLPIIILSIIGCPFYLNLNSILRVFLIIGINITFIFSIIYLIQGITTAGLFLEIKNLKSISILFIFLGLLMPYLFIIIGIADSLFELKMRMLLSKK